MRLLVKKAVPDAVESITYGMIAYKLNKKPLVYFGAFSNHIGLYALPAAHGEFAKQLSLFRQGKGSVQFPHIQPIPFDIIKSMIDFRVKEIAPKLNPGN